MKKLKYENTYRFYKGLNKSVFFGIDHRESYDFLIFYLSII